MTISKTVVASLIVIAVVSLGIGVTASGEEEPAARWYSEQQLAQGKLLFQTHCVTCHGEQAEGTAEWRKTDVNGNYPPPPLNGTAHAWHHPLSVLEQTIAAGGVPVGGVMPHFSEKLSRAEIRSAIAFFQHFWPDEIYARWREIDSR